MKTEPFRPTALRFAAATTACLAVSAMAFGQDRGNISVTMFSDYYTVLEHNDPAVNGMNGFWFRRIYLTYDRTLEEGFSARLRLEALSPGDFTTAGSLTTKYKDVYLMHTGERHRAYFGLTPTPAILNYESFHPGYRAVEKTPLDLYMMATTRDTGFGLKSTMGGGTRYWLMVGNDSGTTSETNKGKAFYVTVSRDLSDKVVGEVNLIYADKVGGDHWTTVAGFLGFTGEGYDASLFYGHQTRSISGGPNVDMDVLSFFVGARGNPKSRPFLRVDLMGNPVPGGDTIPYLQLATTANPMLVIFGVDMALSENVHLIPNIEWVTYSGATGPTPSNDLFFRLTVSASF